MRQIVGEEREKLLVVNLREFLLWLLQKKQPRNQYVFFVGKVSVVNKCGSDIYFTYIYLHELHEVTKTCGNKIKG